MKTETKANQVRPSYPEVCEAVAALHILHTQTHLPVGILLVLQRQKEMHRKVWVSASSTAMNGMLGQLQKLCCSPGSTADCYLLYVQLLCHLLCWQWQ